MSGEHPQEKCTSFPELVSVVIRVRNAAEDLKTCLSSLSTQVLPDSTQMEFIVVDNGSTDKSIEVAQQHGAVIVNLKSEDFTWGRALNRGIEKARGKIVLLLSADAYAADTKFVTEMIKPFFDPKVATVYGRQLPRPDAPAHEAIRVTETFGPKSERFDPDKCVCFPTGKGMLVSNACAAIRRSIWEQNPYDELIEGGEEGVWTHEVLKNGYSYIYQASARVFHSHKDPLFRSACRAVELLQKNCKLTGKHAGLLELFRWIGHFCKCRFRNCFFVYTDLRVRILGLIRCPAEITAFCLAFALLNSPLKHRVRPFLWG